MEIQSSHPTKTNLVGGPLGMGSVEALDKPTKNWFSENQTTPVELANGKKVYVSESDKKKIDEWMANGYRIEPPPKGYKNPPKLGDSE